MGSNANAENGYDRAAFRLRWVAFFVCAAFLTLVVPEGIGQTSILGPEDRGNPAESDRLTIDAAMGVDLSAPGDQKGYQDSGASLWAENWQTIDRANDQGEKFNPSAGWPTAMNQNGPVVDAVEKKEVRRPAEPASEQPWRRPLVKAEIIQGTNASALPPALVRATNGKKLYSFRAENLEMKKALALFARANNLNIVPDLDVTGEITVDLHDLPLDIMMEAFLDAHGFHWVEHHGLIRVHSMETRNFTIDYPRMVRSGEGYSSASLGGAGGGESSGGGGGAGGGGGEGGGGTSIKQEDNIDFWTELQTQLTLLTSGDGKIMLDRMSGIVQVTDRPKILDNIEEFLGLMRDRVKRQVDIKAMIYEVILKEEFNLGVDWGAIINSPDFGLILDTNTIVRAPLGGLAPGVPALGAKIMHQRGDDQVSAIIEALQEQGNVNAVSQPRLRSLNNQMAVIKVGTEQPFFSTSSGFVAGNAGVPGGTFENSSFEMITVGTILSITPQISDDDRITLDVSPVITSLVSIESAGGAAGTTTAPVLDVKQSSSLISVISGETIIIGGLIQDKTTRTDRQVPVLGNIPFVGKAFRGTAQAKHKTELIIFLTPTIVEDELR